MLTSRDRELLNQVGNLLNLFKNPEKIAELVASAKESVAELNTASEKYDTVEAARKAIANADEAKAATIAQRVAQQAEAEAKRTELDKLVNQAQVNVDESRGVLQKAKQDADKLIAEAQALMLVNTKRADVLNTKELALNDRETQLGTKEQSLKERSAKIAALVGA